VAVAAVIGPTRDLLRIYCLFANPPHAVQSHTGSPVNQVPTNDIAARGIIAAERQLLHRFFSGAANAQIGQFIGELSAYSWREPEHATVFEAIRALAPPPSSVASWREELPAQATRMGFPDVEWTKYFGDSGAADEGAPSLDELISRVRQSAPES